QFDGIFAASDLMAIGALKALREEGVSLPVVGFDDIPISSDVSPSLTTIHQPIDEVGRRAAINLIRLISEDHTETTILPVELIVRESSEVKR
ncbi:MAG: substrate-binding domain-containing protein, partial [Mesotoga sp.]